MLRKYALNSMSAQQNKSTFFSVYDNILYKKTFVLIFPIPFTGIQRLLPE